MSTALRPMDPWPTIRWPKSERTGVKRQTRLSRAAPRGDHRHGRRLQQLRRRSHHAKRVAVRQVTPDNRGQKTPGVEGLAALTPAERLAWAHTLPRNGEAAPVRRVDIPKPGTDEPRPLGIPTRADRAQPGVVTHAREPAWEAPFAPNSDGFRPGRSPWEAMGAIDVQSNQQPTWVRDADLATGLERIDHAAWVRTRDASPTVSRHINAWLKAGVLAKGPWSPTTAGTPPGGVASPWFANMARHGLEALIHRAFPGRGAPAVMRDADALVVVHPAREKIEPCQALLAAQRRRMGWAWNPRQTRITPTLQGAAGGAGFDLLGVHLRQDPTQSTRGDNTRIKPSRRARAPHQRQLVESVRRHRRAGPARVIAVLNPLIRGWSHDCATVCSQETVAPRDDAWRQQWRAWSRVRHPHTHRKWGQQRYWRREDGRRPFTPRGRGRR